MFLILNSVILCVLYFVVHNWRSFLSILLHMPNNNIINAEEVTLGVLSMSILYAVLHLCWLWRVCSPVSVALYFGFVWWVALYALYGFREEPICGNDKVPTDTVGQRMSSVLNPLPSASRSSWVQQWKGSVVLFFFYRSATPQCANRFYCTPSCTTLASHAPLPAHRFYDLLIYGKPPDDPQLTSSGLPLNALPGHSQPLRS